MVSVLSPVREKKKTENSGGVPPKEISLSKSIIKDIRRFIHTKLIKWPYASKQCGMSLEERPPWKLSVASRIRGPGIREDGVGLAS